MNRRSFLGMIASLPLVGKLVPRSLPQWNLNWFDGPNGKREPGGVLTVAKIRQMRDLLPFCHYCKQSGPTVIFLPGWNPGCGHHEHRPPCPEMKRWMA